jgi:hypothetical protein
MINVYHITIQRLLYLEQLREREREREREVLAQIFLQTAIFKIFKLI